MRPAVPQHNFLSVVLPSAHHVMPYNIYIHTYKHTYIRCLFVCLLFAKNKNTTASFTIFRDKTNQFLFSSLYYLIFGPLILCNLCHFVFSIFCEPNRQSASIPFKLSDCPQATCSLKRAAGELLVHMGGGDTMQHAVLLLL